MVVYTLMLVSLNLVRTPFCSLSLPKDHLVRLHKGFLESNFELFRIQGLSLSLQFGCDQEGAALCL